MCVHTCRCDAQPSRDLLRRPSGRDGEQDLALPIGQGLVDRATVEDSTGKEIPGEKTDEERRRALAVHL
ncbi:MAG: hypothetical protein AUH33_00490 [Chloroflexi bacterium 13_1_40CM_68_21]|nr:MAG: hypothetical protein AUH33_00490 [Chloroflexi bacterium 13_1_40CM_68_21]